MPSRYAITGMERAALGHAAEWLRYSRGPEYRRDLERAQRRQQAADRAAGHLPACGLTRCAPGCKKGG